MNITSQDLYENVSRLKVWPKEKEFATKMDIIESSTTSAVSNTASKPITDFGINSEDVTAVALPKIRNVSSTKDASKIITS